jgi:hypothetical protein
MEAELLIDQRLWIDQHAFIEIVVWRVPHPVIGSAHDFKYRLAFVVDSECVVRYDNEAGKGDHRHRGQVEDAYRFTTIERLQEDFWNDVEARKR